MRKNFKHVFPVKPVAERLKIDSYKPMHNISFDNYLSSTSKKQKLTQNNIEKAVWHKNKSQNSISFSKKNVQDCIIFENWVSSKKIKRWY